MLNLNGYKNIYLTSDTHFGHINILKYEPGRLSLINRTPSEYQLDPYKCIKEHDNKLLYNWNKTVTDRDVVLILGDFSFHNPSETMSILQSLNGHKILIKGNHDNYLNYTEFDKTLFDGIYDYAEFMYNKQFICLMHYPILAFNHQNTYNTDLKTGIHGFGHIHSLKYITPKYSYNVGVDVNNYTPIHIDKFIKLALNNINGYINGGGVLNE